jgi:transcription elongation GreA/GreB family factor
MDYQFKKYFIQTLINQLSRELEKSDLIAEKERSYATSKDLQAEGKYDTRKIEASYLAGAQSRRVEELRLNLALMRKFHIDDHSQLEEIKIGSLVTCYRSGQEAAKKSYFFISPASGGQILEIDGHNIQLISQHSPIGKALLSIDNGDQFTLDHGKRRLVFTVLSQV